MKHKSKATRVGHVWRATLAAFALTALLMAALTGTRAALASDEIRIVGTVSSTPDTSNGVGEWSIVDDMGQAHTVEADGDTEFDRGVPKIGDRVEVKAEPGTPPLAIEILRMTDDDDSEDTEDEVEGRVLDRPSASDGIGTWLIQTHLFITQTVLADAGTEFEKGVPEIGDWVEAKGMRQADGSLLAERLRPDEYEDGDLIVWLNLGVLPSTIESRYNIEAKSSLLASANIYLFSTEDANEGGLVDQLLADPDVLWAELNYVQGVPEEDGYSTWGWGGTDSGGYVNQYAFDQVDLAASRGIYDGDGVVVAVLDTGVSLSHTMLVTRLVLPSLDVISDDTIPDDEPAGLAWGHGTHVAGIIAHVAPRADILPVRVLDSNGLGSTFLLAYAIDWAIGQGVDVINLSLGTDVDSRLLKDKVQEAVDAGIVVIAAAGNNDAESPRYPAAYEGVTAVTAVDDLSHKAIFANYGAWVDLSAPGVGITSTVIGPLGQGYASWSGTSMAAPFVSGAAALMQQRYPKASGAAISERLVATADELDTMNPGYDEMLGGMLDVGAAAPGAVTLIPSVDK